MKKISSIQMIDSLAEMTRHQDREVIEKSLLKTIDELMPSTELQLFKIIVEETSEISLYLLSYSINGNVNIIDMKFNYGQMSTSLQKGIVNAVEYADLQQVEGDENNNMYILYPAINKEGKVFALLIQGCEQLPSLDAPRYIHGLLKVYSNYLELIRQTQTDKLTGLLNRETLDKEITRALIKNTALKQFETSGGVVKRKTDVVGYWVGLLDIDHFKNINDMYGHLFGDEVLILVSRVMEKLLRNNDYIFRFGGEEFVVFLQADGLREAYSAFERIRRYISEYSFPKLETLTVSIGVTEVRVQPGALDVVGEADVALYYAKDHGRNQVFIYEELLEKGLIKEQGSGVCNDIEIF